MCYILLSFFILFFMDMKIYAKRSQNQMKLYLITKLVLFHFTDSAHTLVYIIPIY